MNSRVTILTVCTGNLWRSPAAAALLQHGMINIACLDSAGTHAQQGLPMPSLYRSLLTQDNIPADHRSKLLTTSQVSTADLILTATKNHRDNVVRLQPSAIRRTYTLIEFALLLDYIDHERNQTPTQRLRSAIAAVVSRRSKASSYNLDLSDPQNATEQVALRVFNQIKTAASTITAVVTE